MNIYQHYNFTWKWINQAYDISDGRADEFGSEYERTVNTETVCGEGMKHKIVFMMPKIEFTQAVRDLN